MLVSSLCAASGGADYTSLNIDITFPSNSADGHMECVNISITDDMALENDELFLGLTSTSDPDVELMIVELMISITVITIIDNDG